MVDTNPATQYKVPVKTATLSESFVRCGVEYARIKDGRHVKYSVAAPSIIDSVMVWALWYLGEWVSVGSAAEGQ